MQVLCTAKYIFLLSDSLSFVEKSHDEIEFSHDDLDQNISMLLFHQLKPKLLLSGRSICDLNGWSGKYQHRLCWYSNSIILTLTCTIGFTKSENCIPKWTTRYLETKQELPCNSWE